MAEPGQVVGLTGSTGLVGGEAMPFLRAVGHEVVPFVRDRTRAAASGGIKWNPTRGEIDAAALEGLDAIVHLAGETIAGRWTTGKRRRILDSRVVGTRLLCDALARCQNKPRVLVSASAIGIYGDTEDTWVDETSPLGSERFFLAKVCREWEAATEPARAAGIRVVNLRIGMVLSSRGGALAKLLRPASLGLAGPIAGGSQFISWIDAEDLSAVISHAIDCDHLSGPVNAVSPGPVRQREFAETLGEVLKRPAFLPLPKFVVSAVFGQMGREVLVAGQRVRPTRLFETGFHFEYPTLEQSLRHQLGD